MLAEKRPAAFGDGHERADIREWRHSIDSVEKGPSFARLTNIADPPGHHQLALVAATMRINRSFDLAGLFNTIHPIRHFKRDDQKSSGVTFKQTLQVSWIPALPGYVSNHVPCAVAWLAHSNSSSSIFAALRSEVAKPSVNQP
jgi:hypothetical protein